MDFLLFAGMFFLGAILASFAGVVAARLHTGQSFLRGRSRCDACDAPLETFSLVPVLSYAFSAGKARCCGISLSPLSPLSELLLGALFGLAYAALGSGPALAFTLIAFFLLYTLTLYDLAHQMLPTSLLAPFVAASALAAYCAAPGDFVRTLFAALLIGLSLALVHILSRGRAMGLADAPFAAGLALLVGADRALPGFVFSFWIGAAIGIVILARRPRGSRMGVEVPFAPFLAAGFLLAYFTQWNPFALFGLM